MRSGAQSGFSMIELLVVIAIIGMLAGMVAVNVVGQGEKAKQKAAYAQIKMLEDALEVYRLDNSSYPSGDKGLMALIDGKYIKEKKLPKDPWNNEYIYSISGSNVDIVSLGADGAEGGSGNDCDISLVDGICNGDEGDEDE